MATNRFLSRRQFVKATAAAAVFPGALAGGAVSSQGGDGSAAADSMDVRVPLKVGHRAASMRMVGDFEVFKVARRIPGLLGVELNVAGGDPNLWDLDAVRRYKSEAWRWGIMVPSVSGPWDRGVSIMRSPAAGINLLRAIRSAELLGALVILVPFFRDNAPDMSDESAYGPVVKLLRDAAPAAAEAGVILGLENSLSPADNAKLVDLVDHPNVKVYYDPHNMDFYGHGEQAIPGIKLLGRDRICQVHVKNGANLIEEPGPIDWPAAFEAFAEIGYDGWYVLESSHPDRQHLLEATRRNIEFMSERARMPLG